MVGNPKGNNPGIKREFKQKVELGTVTQYSLKWGLTRDLIYDRLNSGKLTAYEVAEVEEMDPSGVPTKIYYRYYVDLNADPEVRALSQ